MRQKLNIALLVTIVILVAPSPASSGEVGERSSKSQCSEERSRLLSEGLSKRKAGDELCDAKIMVGDKSFRVHKIVMSIFSPYFKTRFKSEMQGSMERQDEFTLNSENIDAEAFEMLKDYMYTSQITIDDSSAQRLLAGASYLQMTNVKAHCCAYMKKEVNAENCIGIKYMADRYSCSELSNFATDFILDSFEEVAKSGEFFELTKDQLIDIISDDELATSEDKVYEAVMRWIRYQDNSDVDRSIYLRTLMQHVRFPQIEPNYLLGVTEDPLIQKCPECLEYVKKTEDYIRKHQMSGKREEGESSLEARFKPRRSDYLYSVGGSQFRVWISSVERYDPRKNEWTEVASMNSPRGRVGVAVLNNVLFAVGGFSGSYLSSIESYDPRFDKWTDNVKPLDRGEPTHNSVATLDGILYVICGLVSPQILMKYDPNINEWIECRPLRLKRWFYVVGVLDGYIYVLGGFVNNEISNIVERYDPTRNEWHDESPMITKKYYFASVGYKGYLYAVGGTISSKTQLNSAERYYASERKWEKIAPMNEPRYGHGLAVANGLIYAVGGLVSYYARLNTVEVYDPATDTWSRCAPMLHARGEHGLASMKY